MYRLTVPVLKNNSSSPVYLNNKDQKMDSNGDNVVVVVHNKDRVVYLSMDNEQT